MSDDADDLIRMIRDSADAAGSREDLSRVRGLRFKGAGFDRAKWAEMAEMGWVGLLTPEAAGGSALGIAALAALAEELGARLTPEPLIETAVAASLLAGEAQAAALDGRALVLPAWQERPDALAADAGITLAGDRANGRRRFVLGAEGADAYLVLGADAASLVRREAAGVALEGSPTQDGGRAATLTFHDAAAEPLDVSPARVTEALDLAALATSAYLLGVAGRAFEMTLDYLRTREQFGKPIGSFQALQHRAADLSVQIALTRASVGSAVEIVAASPDLATRQAAVSRAKSRAGDTAMLVTRQAIQLHGGIGFSDEHDIGLYLRRAMVLVNAYGSPALHRRRYAEATRGARVEEAA